MNAKSSFKQSTQSRIEPLESRIAPAAIIVTTTSDTPVAEKTTLRQALATADADLLAHPGVVNTITFKLPAAPAHTENVITLGGTALSSNGFVNIVGPGAGKLIINGNAASGDFNIHGTTGTTTISGLSIINGKLNNGGGGFYSTSSLSLKNVVITGNTSTSFGSAINIHGSTTVPINLSIANSTITGNSVTASSTYAIFDFDPGSISITSSVITGNNAGISGTFTGISTGLTVTKSLISGNSRAGIKTTGLPATAKITITGTTIADNGNTGSGFSGAVLGGGIISITGSTFDNNVGDADGAGLNASNFASLTITGSAFQGNSTTAANNSGDGGGGLAIFGPSSATPVPVKISTSTFADNRTNSDGAGVLASSGLNLSITNSTFTGNQTSDSHSHGGGLCVNGTGNSQVNLSITSSKFIDNVSTQGGGISTDPGNDATGTGTFSMVSSTLSGNFSGNGGGLRLQSSGKATLKSDTVTNNIGTQYGGGLSLNNNSSITVTGGTFSGNLSARGGGIEVYNSIANISNATISGNIAPGADEGAGVNSQNFSTVILHHDNIFANNSPDGTDVDGTGITFS
jgi:hypothetical protein